jgi:hypothetical protein
MLVKITRYGDEWLTPLNIIRRNYLTGYTVTFVGGNPENLRENLWEITGENIIDVFSVLQPVAFSGDWDEYVEHYNDEPPALTAIKSVLADEISALNVKYPELLLTADDTVLSAIPKLLAVRALKDEVVYLKMLYDTVKEVQAQ